MNLETLVVPLGGDQPSGVELRNDARFHAIERLLEPAGRAYRVKADGTINESAPPVSWDQIADDGEALAADGRDLRLLVILVRALFATDGFDGLARGMGMLTQNISEYWDSLHPALRDRDDPKAATLPRANALRQFENDDNGLLGDLRFSFAFSPRGIGPVSFDDLAAVLLTDFEVLARSATGLNKAEQDAILARHTDRAKRAALACRAMATEQPETVTEMVAGMAASLGALEALCAAYGAQSGLGTDGGLTLPHLAELLGNCRKVLEKAQAEAQPDAAGSQEAGAAEAAGQGGAGDAPAPAAASVAKAPAANGQAANGPSGAINSRLDVEAALDRIVAFYERTEPSSPIPHVARRLRRMVSMDFLQLMQEVAPSGLKEFRSIAGIEDGKK